MSIQTLINLIEACAKFIEVNHGNWSAIDNANRLVEEKISMFLEQNKKINVDKIVLKSRNFTTKLEGTNG